MTLEIVNKRSSALNDAPTPAQLEDGEIGINYNKDSLALYVKDSSGAIRKIAGSGGEGLYWDLTGTTLSPTDNTYGVDIGGGKIELKPDGSITAAGTIDCDSKTLTQDGIRLDNTGTAQIRQDTGTVNALEIYQGGNAAGNIKASITGAGSITAAGALSIDATVDAPAASIKNNSGASSAAGGLVVETSTTAVDILQLKNSGSEVFACRGDGLITAVGDVKIGTGGFNGAAVYLQPGGDAYAKSVTARSDGTFSDADTNLFIGQNSASVNKFLVKADGSITASGDVKIGGTSAAPNIELKPDGSINAVQFYATVTGDYAFRVNNKGGYYVDGSGNEALYVRKASDSNPVITLDGADGSITAAGDITLSNDQGLSTTIQARGGIEVQNKNGGNDNRNLWEGSNWSGAVTSSISATGSITAGKDIEFKTDGTTTLNSTGDGSVYGAFNFRGIRGADNDGNAYLTLSKDNGAEFTGSITAAGDVKIGGTASDPAVGIYNVGAIGAKRGTGATGTVTGINWEQSGTIHPIVVFPADKTGGNLSDYNFLVKKDGSITAASTLTIGDPAGNSYSKGIICDPNQGSGSYFQVYCTADQTNNPLSVYRSDGDVPFKVSPAGSITAAGDVLCGTDSTLTKSGVKLQQAGGCYSVRAAGQESNPIFLGGVVGNDQAFQVFGNGSASFAGSVNCRELVANTQNDAEGIYIKKSDGSFPVILKQDGSGTFAGGVTATDFYSVFSNAKATLNYSGISFKDLSGIQTVNIQYDGSASFAGVVKATRVLGGDGCFQAGITGGAVNASIYADGSATFAGTVTAVVVPPSDARFKENIAPANPQLADVVALGGILKNFDWNEDAPLNEELRSQRQLGLIAQEVAEVCPSIVKDIHRTKQGKELTPEEVIPAVVEPAHTIPAVTKEIPNPKSKTGETITVEVKPAEEVPEKVITPEQVIPATYEVLDDSYKGLSQDALVMKLIGAVAELTAEVNALKSA